MNQTTVTNDAKITFTAEDWDELRQSLKGSEMAKVNLCSLAKNLELKWPIRDKDEIPSRYLGYTLEELGELPEFFGKDNRLPLLYTILLETRRMDDPFMEMIQQFDEKRTVAVKPKTPLQLLEIPANLPVDLMGLSKETLKSCHQGEHETVGQLVAFLRVSKSAVNLNEEYREFLQAHDNMDKKGIGRYLPTREGHKGIFLAEAIGHIGRRLNDQQAATLLYAYNLTSDKESWNESLVMPKAGTLSLITQVTRDVLQGFQFMPDQAQELRTAINGGTNSSIRFFVSLNDPDLESLAIAIAMATLGKKPRLKGFMGGFLK